jgi:hypothetical protein
MNLKELYALTQKDPSRISKDDALKIIRELIYTLSQTVDEWGHDNILIEQLQDELFEILND